MTTRGSIVSTVTVGCALLATSPAALAGSHTWRVNEVFSNPSGTIQFIELKECCGGQFETGVPGHNLTSNTRSFLIPGAALPSPTSFKTLLIATPAFAALPGMPTPDYVLPANMVPFFNPAGDTISYVPWDSMAFGAGQVPTDCTHSLNDSNGSNVVAVSSPTNYGGATAALVNCSCAGDAAPFGGDGTVDVNDLLAVISTWGPCPAPPAACTGDIEPPGGNGQVDVNDLLTVVSHWGPCS